MNKIKFSHDYKKLPAVWEGTHAKLMAVYYEQDMEKLKRSMPAFIKYDTAYCVTPYFTEPVRYYPLNFDRGIILFFIHINTGQVFTTIRRHTPKKYAYYKSKIGEIFVLEKS